MKKILLPAWLAAVLIFALALSVTVFAEQTTVPAAEEGRLQGDMDADGELTSGDARLILRAALSLEKVPASSLPYADVDRNSLTEASDARDTLRCALGLEAPAGRHTYEVEIGKEATCVSEGNLSYVCSVCGEAGSVTIPPLPHAYGAETVTPASCDKAGEAVRVCRDCGAKDSRTIRAKGHVWTSSGDTVSCSVCSAKARGFVTVGEDRFFCRNGVKEKSWCEIDGAFYFFDRSSGKQRAGCTVDGLKLTGDGRAVETPYSREKIRTFIKAKKILAEITDPSDSVEDKKYKAFMWVLRKPYRQYREVGVAMQSEGFEMLFANDIFDRGNGCCGSTSYAFAFLAVEAGCRAVYVNDD